MLIWERPEPSARASLSPLSRDRIVRAAIKLADADGLQAVSLRKVAAVLDAGPMRLYRYVDTKEELLDLMVDAVYGEIPAPPPEGDDWRAEVRSLVRGIRGAALRHEWFADLLGGRPHLGPAALGHLDATLTALRSAPGIGDDPDALMRALQAVNGYVLGAVRHEIVELRAERASGLTEHQWQAAAGPYLARAFAAGRYPALAHVVGNGSHQDPAEMFDAGLDVLLTGIAAGA
ncbi:TetR/AcrR family transcriptional regulator [Streptomyces sp. UNOB3_S3]|uniref:TetR/AcrR family transcriptional regulator n=1 Tax=Streptomyces sp. UNOB3_S3 TaxID=2871682 RepID=UPI001E6009A8|nr:TetR/AcrR family transcriptional regulator [Streptomyces sp. UNOB3_S3]MCC3776270.1 TetR/AcrR family transcriptional regulator [Streptomyces sp. UNOB3_S3]